MNSLTKVAKQIAPQVQSRTMVRATQPKRGGHDPFEHPHLVWDHLGGKTRYNFSKAKTGLLMVSGIIFGFGVINFSVVHQNKKHGFTK